MLPGFSSKRVVIFLLTSALLSCSGKIVLHTEVVELQGMTLSFQEPEVFNFEIKEPGLHDFVLEASFLPGKTNSGDSIPFYFIHEAPGMVEAEGKFKLAIKDQDGNWTGEIHENGKQRTIGSTFAEDIHLSAGKHQVRIYGDNPEPGQPTQGIVRLTFKVLR